MGGGLDTKNGDFAITTFKKDKSRVGQKKATDYLENFPFTSLEVTDNSTKSTSTGLDKVTSKIALEILEKFGFKDISKENFIKLVSLFDSRHDFEMIMSDKIKHNKDKSKLLIHELSFSTMGKKVFGLQGTLDGQNNDLFKFGGNLTIQGGKIGKGQANIIKSDDLENIFFLNSLAMKNAELTTSGINRNDKFKYVSCGDIYSFKKAKGSEHKEGYDRLSKEIYTFFSQYQESNIDNRIPLIIDASILLFTSSKARQGQRDPTGTGKTETFYGDSERFAYLLTAESISDPSPKKNFTKIQENNNNVFPFTNDSCFIEANNGERVHDYNFDKIRVKLQMNYPTVGLPNVKVVYEPLDDNNVAIPKAELVQTLNIGTEAKKHLHSIGQLTKQYRGLSAQLKEAIVCQIDKQPYIDNALGSQASGSGIFDKLINWIKTFVGNSSNEKILSEIYQQFINDKDFVCEAIIVLTSIIFAQKRLGDQLQARVVKKVFNNRTGLNFYSKTELHNGKKKTTKITKAVLVTHDRMLFALALQLDIPVIFDYGTMVLMYNPLAGPPAAGAQSGGRKKTKKRSTKSGPKTKRKKETVSGRSVKTGDEQYIKTKIIDNINSNISDLYNTVTSGKFPKKLTIDNLLSLSFFIDNYKLPKYNGRGGANQSTQLSGFSKKDLISLLEERIKIQKYDVEFLSLLKTLFLEYPDNYGDFLEKHFYYRSKKKSKQHDLNKLYNIFYQNLDVQKMQSNRINNRQLSFEDKDDLEDKFKDLLYFIEYLIVHPITKSSISSTKKGKSSTRTKPSSKASATSASGSVASSAYSIAPANASLSLEPFLKGTPKYIETTLNNIDLKELLDIYYLGLFTFRNKSGHYLRPTNKGKPTKYLQFLDEFIMISKENSFEVYQKGKELIFVAKDINNLDDLKDNKFDKFKILFKLYQEHKSVTIGLKFTEEKGKMFLKFTYPHLGYFPEEYGELSDLGKSINMYSNNNLSDEQEQYYLNDVMEILTDLTSEKLSETINEMRDQRVQMLELEQIQLDSEKINEELKHYREEISEAAVCDAEESICSIQSGGSIKITNIFKTLEFYEGSIIFDDEEKNVSFEKCYLENEFYIASDYELNIFLQILQNYLEQEEREFGKLKFKTQKIINILNIDYIEQCLEELKSNPKYADIIQPIINRIYEIRDYLNANFEKMTFQPDFDSDLRFNINYLATKNKIKTLLDNYHLYNNKINLLIDKATNNHQLYTLSVKYSLNNYGLTKLSYNIVSAYSNILNNIGEILLQKIHSFAKVSEAVSKGSRIQSDLTFKKSNKLPSYPKYSLVKPSSLTTTTAVSVAARRKIKRKKNKSKKFKPKVQTKKHKNRNN